MLQVSFGSSCSKKDIFCLFQKSVRFRIYLSEIPNHLVSFVWSPQVITLSISGWFIWPEVKLPFMLHFPWWIERNLVDFNNPFPHRTTNSFHPWIMQSPHHKQVLYVLCVCTPLLFSNTNYSFQYVKFNSYLSWENVFLQDIPIFSASFLAPHIISCLSSLIRFGYRPSNFCGQQKMEGQQLSEQ